MQQVAGCRCKGKKKRKLKKITLRLGTFCSYVLPAKWTGTAVVNSRCYLMWFGRDPSITCTVGVWCLIPRPKGKWDEGRIPVVSLIGGYAIADSDRQKWSSGDGGEEYIPYIQYGILIRPNALPRSSYMPEYIWLRAN